MYASFDSNRLSAKPGDFENSLHNLFTMKNNGKISNSINARVAVNNGKVMADYGIVVSDTPTVTIKGHQFPILLTMETMEHIADIYDDDYSKI